MNLKERCFPELLLFPDAKSRKAGWRAACTDNEYLKVHYVVVSLVAVVAVSEMFFLGSGPGRAVALGVMVGQPLTATIVSAVLCRRAVRTKLRLELHFYGVRTCIDCGYQMGDLPSKTCPECGAAVFSKRDTT